MFVQSINICQKFRYSKKYTCVSSGIDIRLRARKLRNPLSIPGRDKIFFSCCMLSSG